MNISSTLYRGIVNKELKVEYVLQYESGGQYQTVRKRENGGYLIRPAFGLSISEGFEKSRVFIPSNKYYHAISLLQKINKIVAENIFEIFPNSGSKTEFSIDSKMLDRYQTEKALSVSDMSVYPCIYANETNECFPAIQLNTSKSSVRIPFDDSLAIEKMFSTFDPHIYGSSLLTMLR